jgi:hypothetical protein
MDPNGEYARLPIRQDHPMSGPAARIGIGNQRWIHRHDRLRGGLSALSCVVMCPTPLTFWHGRIVEIRPLIAREAPRSLF